MNEYTISVAEKPITERFHPDGATPTYWAAEINQGPSVIGYCRGFSQDEAIANAKIICDLAARQPIVVTYTPGEHPA